MEYDFWRKLTFDGSQPRTSIEDDICQPGLRVPQLWPFGGRNFFILTEMKELEEQTTNLEKCDKQKKTK